MTERATVRLHRGGTRVISGVIDIRAREGLLRVVTEKKVWLFPLSNIKEAYNEEVE